MAKRPRTARQQMYARKNLFAKKIEARVDYLLTVELEKRAKKALYLYRDMFSSAGKRKTPKKAKPSDYPYRVWEKKDGTTRELTTVKEFKKLLKRDKRKGTGFDGIEVGALSRIKERNYNVKDEARRKKQELGNQERAARGLNVSGGAKRAARRPKKSKAWVDVALKDGYDGPLKIGASAPGDVPTTWKNPDRGVDGKQKRSFPDYYLRSAVRLVRENDREWNVVIKPYFASGYATEVFKTLEFGGSLPKKTKRLIGYEVIYYRLKGGRFAPKKRGGFDVKPGVEYGRKRRRIHKKFEFQWGPVRIASRPFLSALKERLDAEDAPKFRIDF